MIYFGQDKPPIIFNVEYDEAFAAAKVSHLREFYFTELLPYVADCINSKILLIPQGYKLLMATQE